MIFPQCEILSVGAAQEILFVGGGRFPSRDWFSEVARGRKIFGVDRGIELCHACNVTPNFLIGDFDSASDSAVKRARAENVPTEQHPADKDLTDTQLALRRATEIFGEHTAILTAAFGGRADHLYSTIHTCAALERRTFLADDREIIFYLRGDSDGDSAEVKFFRAPHAVSLLPMTETCAGVTTRNLHWELDGATLTQNLPNAVSNRVERDEIYLRVGSGTLAIYICFGE